MYSSIDRVDVMAETEDGALLVQTDHRSAAEIEKQPELSVLFALARVLNARQLAEAKKMKLAAVVYAPMQPPPQFLVDALATVGAHLEEVPTMKRTKLTSDRDPAQLADAMFAALSASVCERFETEDPAQAIDALEEDVGGAFGHDPDEENEIEYWTAVFELMALTGEAVRERVGGSWVTTDQGTVPFAFELANGSLLLPANRALRALDEGADQGMTVLLGSLDQFAAPKPPTADGPIVPSLRSKAEAVSGGYAYRPLFDNMPPDVEIPVICWGHDSERLFALIREDSGETPVDHEAALANLRDQDVVVSEHEIAGMTFLSVGDSFFASEKLLDRAFMRELHERLDSDLLGAVVSRRHVLLVTGLSKAPLNAGLLARFAASELETHGGRGICPHTILVQDGLPVGMALPNPSPSPPDDEPPKKRGFFARLFGRN